jgi:hypothetical protein
MCSRASAAQPCTRCARGVRHRARMCRIVMYVPDCTDITLHNSSYSQSKETGMWDTREAAANILRSMLAAHGERLGELPQQLPGGSGSLRDLAALGDNATNVHPL